MNRKLGSIDEVHEMKPKLEHKKILCTCDMCKMKFDAGHLADTENGISSPVYYDSRLSITVKKEKKTKTSVLHMCPYCTTKLLELLDKHFPRLNLEDEL